ncbi:MAG: hypothetical protein FWF45_01415 [Coriobacteriia bacterium]|nr:hypothetical protein [Coriobacteriia bacterium]
MYQLKQQKTAHFICLRQMSHQNNEVKRSKNELVKVGVSAGLCLVLLAASFIMSSCGSSGAQSTSANAARPKNDIRVIEIKTDMNLISAAVPQAGSKDDIVSMTTQEMIDYYGVNFIPSAIPKGLSRTKDEFCIYKDNGGLGKVYWDQNSVLWTDTGNNSTSNKSFGVTVNKGVKPLLFTNPPSVQVSKPFSKINGTDVTIAHYTDGKTSELYASFAYRNTAFLVTAQNISQDDFVKAISSLIK